MKKLNVKPMRSKFISKVMDIFSKDNDSSGLQELPKVTENDNDTIDSMSISDSELISQLKYRGKLISNLFSKADKQVIEKYASHRGCLDVKEAACMAAHVYDKYKHSLLIGGWSLDTSFDDLIVLQDDDLQTKLYSRLDNKGKKEYAYVFAGTRESNFKDWRNNIWQILGISSDYSQLLSNAKLLSDKIKDSKLFFVGHSKGGGEASLCSLATGRPAIVFNPAPLSRFTLLFNGEKLPNDVLIDAYVCAKDPLYLLNNALNNESVQLGMLLGKSFTGLGVLKALDLKIIGDINVLELKEKNLSILENHFMSSILTYYRINHKFHSLPQNSRLQLI